MQQLSSSSHRFVWQTYFLSTGMNDIESIKPAVRIIRESNAILFDALYFDLSDTVQ